MEQVLNNLISNALFHLPIAGQLRISAKLVSDMIRVEIENQGEPISEDVID